MNTVRDQARLPFTLPPAVLGATLLPLLPPLLTSTIVRTMIMSSAQPPPTAIPMMAPVESTGELSEGGVAVTVVLLAYIWRRHRWGGNVGGEFGRI